jgi:hypothetical protein
MLQFAVYLISRHGVLNYNLRDVFSSSSRRESPSKNEKLRLSLNYIPKALNEVDGDDLTYYWGINMDPEKSRFKQWKELIRQHTNIRHLKEINDILEQM